jgi:hypothetical protein
VVVDHKSFSHLMRVAAVDLLRQAERAALDVVPG